MLTLMINWKLGRHYCAIGMLSLLLSVSQYGCPNCGGIMVVIIANILGILNGVFCITSTFMSTKKRMLLMQCADMICSIISCLLLGGLSGAMVTCVALVRNIICYKKDPSDRFRVIIIVITAIASIAVNNDSIFGLLPVIAAVGYAWVVMSCKKTIGLLLGLIGNKSLWIIYKIILMNYAGAVTDIVVVAFSIFNIINKKRKED